MAKKSSKQALHNSQSTTELQKTLQTALKFHQNGDFDQAKKFYQQVIRMDPKQAVAIHYLGAIEHQQGNDSHAVQLIRKAIKLDPNMHQAYNNLGIILRALGKFEQAKSTYLKLIKIKPDYADAYCNLGAVYESLNETSSAIDSFNTAIKLNPSYVNAYNALGIIYRRTKKLNLSISYFQKAIELEPSFAEAHNNLGNVFYEQKEYQIAVKSYQFALKYKADYAEAFNNIGRALKEIGQFEQAILSFKQGLALRPESDEFLFNCALLLQEMGESHLAVEYYKKIVSLKTRSNAHLLTMSCFSIFTQKELFELHREWGQSIIKKLPDKRPASRQLNYKDCEPLRIGYVSADFRMHSVSYFFEPLIAQHDKAKVEIFCYANNAEEDHVTQSIKAYADHWRAITFMSDIDVVTQVKKDKIDILIDLSGHTEGNRLEVFAHKPAPIQVTWLGYPNTTGLSTIDYRLTDEYADPESDGAELHTEKLVRLPHGFLCFKGDESLVYNLEAPISKLKHITFGSFNNFIKMTHEVLDTWSDILARIPDSKLILKSKQLVNESTKKNVLKIFNAKGVSSDRITLLGKVENYSKHLEMYGKIDIALDTFPYNGTTTTFETLFAGVPLITQTGASHASPLV